MIRYAISLFFLISLLCTASNAAAKSRIIKESNILKYLKIVEGWDRDLISHETLTLSEDKTKTARAYRVNAFCGKGSCTHHLFLFLKENKWKYIGKISGKFEIIQTVKRGLYILRAGHSMPGLSEKTFFHKYKYNGKAYEEW